MFFRSQIVYPIVSLLFGMSCSWLVRHLYNINILHYTFSDLDGEGPDFGTKEWNSIVSHGINSTSTLYGFVFGVSLYFLLIYIHSRKKAAEQGAAANP